MRDTCDASGGVPDLVLFPALACDQRMWGEVVERLGGRFGIFIPRLWEYYTIAEAAEDVGECLRNAGIKETFAAGLSMGGYAAFELIRRFPGLVRKAAIVDSMAFPDAPERNEKRNQAISLVESGKYEQVLQAYADSAIWSGGERAASARELLMKMAQRIGPGGYIRSAVAIRDRGGYEDVLKGAEIPLLFLAGDHDGLTPPFLAREMAETAKGGRFLEIPESGHLSALENPDAVAAALLDFFR